MACVRFLRRRGPARLRNTLFDLPMLHFSRSAHGDFCAYEIGVVSLPPRTVNKTAHIGCILVSCLIATIVLLVALCTNGKEGTTPHKVISATEEKTITAEYLLSYILPLFAFDFTQWSQVILFLIFYLTLGFLCIRHNYFSVNIILEIAKFRFYTCMVENEDGQKLEQRIISHRRLNGCIGDILFLKSLNNEYKLDIQQ